MFMNERYEEIDHNGYRIAIECDEYAENPDDWGNDEMFLVYDHRDFCVRRKGFDPDDIFERMQEGKKTYNGYWVFPVYAYIHSGVALSLGRNSYPFTDRWDVSFKGFALVKRMKHQWSEDKAYNLAEGLIKTWNMYLSGEVYGFNVYELDEDGEEVDSIDSCWGFYGDEGIKQIIDESKCLINGEIELRNKTRFTKLKALIKNNVPLSIRESLVN